jgi:hypothetical protein
MISFENKAIVALKINYSFIEIFKNEKYIKKNNENTRSEYQRYVYIYTFLF